MLATLKPIIKAPNATETKTPRRQAKDDVPRDPSTSAQFQAMAIDATIVASMEEPNKPHDINNRAQNSPTKGCRGSTKAACNGICSTSVPRARRAKVISTETMTT
mmetsp:Transcript_39385/g.62438  ORF Transcript_39385/g.62438 Transcript_39385/m.62438 type:complete len:105 (-) Transcript_39385:122-436(-)